MADMPFFSVKDALYAVLGLAGLALALPVIFVAHQLLVSHDYR